MFLKTLVACRIFILAVFTSKDRWWKATVFHYRYYKLQRELRMDEFLMLLWLQLTFCCHCLAFNEESGLDFLTFCWYEWLWLTKKEVRRIRTRRRSLRRQELADLKGEVLLRVNNKLTYYGCLVYGRGLFLSSGFQFECDYIVLLVVR